MEITESGAESSDQASIKKERSESASAHSNGVNVNGLSNGHGEKDHSRSSHHKSGESRDKERHREKDKNRDKDKHRSSSSSKDKDKHNTSSSSSSSKDKDRSDKDKHRDKDKERSSKDKERSKSDKERSDKEKDRSKSDKDKDRKHREEKSKSEHKTPSSSSSSASKEHKSSSSKDKERSREKERKEKERGRDSSWSPDKKHKEGEHRSKEHKSASKEKPKHREESLVKQEPVLPVKVKRELEMGDEEDERPLAPPPSKVKPEPAESDDDDRPLLMKQQERASQRMERSSIQKRKSAAPVASDSEEDVPLVQRKKVKKESKKRSKREDSEEEEDFKPVAKKAKNKVVKKEDSRNSAPESPTKKGGRKKKEEEGAEVWKWWEENKPSDGTKWTYLEHKGPVFAPPYEPLPDEVKFKYNGKVMKLSESAEEVATFYAKMLEHDFTTKSTFNENFFKDWRKMMTSKEKEIITDIKKCDFKDMHSYFLQKSEERKAQSKEEKNKTKDENAEIQKIYGIAVIDGHNEKIGNFKIEPPGLFRGRGEHPKMGRLKKRVMPEDVIINCSKDAPVPKPPPGHRWKEVRHDCSVTWLASWTENVQGQVKYVMLNPSSKLKGEKDMQKYETARKLHKCIDKIREEYRNDWRNKEMRIRQRSVALYFIDRLALRAGNEKDDDQADTVGCCSLRVEHISLHEEKDGKPCVVVFDFLGKDSIRYYNEVPVEKRVFKNLQLFMENKNKGDDLFDRLNTAILNKHLNDLMDGLTAKVFRTYNASITLQQQLDELTEEDSNLPEKLLSYNRANRAVAILCNHQRSVPKTHAKSMENLKNKIDAKKQAVADAEDEYAQAKKDFKRNKSEKEKINLEKRKKAVERNIQQLGKLELMATDREENKEIALGTSKLNYLDPRISVAWCKRNDVPIEKIYNKTQREKFRWAIDMAGPEYVF